MSESVVQIGDLIPHGDGARMVHALLKTEEQHTIGRFVVPRDFVMVDPQTGRLDETAYFEMIAQTFAAGHGYHLTTEQRPLHKGMLLGVKDMVIAGKAYAGDTLLIEVKTVAKFGDFGVVDGTVGKGDGTRLASAQIKVWRPSTDAEAENS